MKEAASSVFWPGTEVRKSTNNGFTLGFGGTYHGYESGLAADKLRPTNKRNSRPKRAFGAIGGTIPSLNSDYKPIK